VILRAEAKVQSSLDGEESTWKQITEIIFDFMKVFEELEGRMVHQDGSKISKQAGCGRRRPVWLISGGELIRYLNKQHERLPR
jgi:hypothetical protein